MDENDLYAFYKEVESLSCVPPNYMETQTNINAGMRRVLVDWLIKVHFAYELMEETLYLTVQLVDRFLAVRSVTRDKLQLVGATALRLACKYKEVSVPAVGDFVWLAGSREKALEMERAMANALSFSFSLPTTYVFLQRFLGDARAEESLKMVAFFMVDLSLVEYEMLRFAPSLLAAAALFTARCALSGRRQWGWASEESTSYKEDQLIECAKLMVGFHQKLGTGKLTGVQEKYSTSKYGNAARVQPARFLMD